MIMPYRSPCWTCSPPVRRHTIRRASIPGNLDQDNPAAVCILNTDRVLLVDFSGISGERSPEISPADTEFG